MRILQLKMYGWLLNVRLIPDHSAVRYTVYSLAVQYWTVYSTAVQYCTVYSTGLQYCSVYKSGKLSIQEYNFDLNPTVIGPNPTLHTLVDVVGK